MEVEFSRKTQTWHSLTLAALPNIQRLCMAENRAKRLSRVTVSLGSGKSYVVEK